MIRFSPDGSSPRMRGTLVNAEAIGRSRRFIPAHAGNTNAANFSLQISAVHPRACGEHSPALYAEMMYRGSSPRMRGTPRSTSSSSRLERFIPAHAGNTAGEDGVVPYVAVHPRACGEHRILFPRPAQHSGSSPRMRGTLFDGADCEQWQRFIPAHAGNTHAAT